MTLAADPSRNAADVAALTILDLWGGTGSWSAPYREAGYRVIVVDPRAEGPDDCRVPVGEVVPFCGMWEPVQGVLCAPPSAAPRVVSDCLAVVAAVEPKWWALKNSSRRVEMVLPELAALGPALTFDTGDKSAPRTHLCGRFRVPALRRGRQSATTFARAFFEANP